MQRKPVMRLKWENGLDSSGRSEGGDTEEILDKFLEIDYVSRGEKSR